MSGYYHDSADSASSFSKSSMPPPSHLRIRLINLSSVKAAINAGRDEPVRSLFRPTVRLLQITFALVSGVSYTIELDHRYSASITNFVYAEVVFGQPITNRQCLRRPASTSLWAERHHLARESLHRHPAYYYRCQHILTDHQTASSTVAPHVEGVVPLRHIRQGLRRLAWELSCSVSLTARTNGASLL
jgi:hypothetical protein